MDQQTLLNLYYGQFYPARTLDNVQPENLCLLDLINQNEFIIDVGCGNNFFKTKFHNLIGVDPANCLADYQETIEEFSHNFVHRSLPKFDVAICLGSLNFGNEEKILYQISCMEKLMNHQSRIYWRNSNEHTHSSNINFDFTLDIFKWTIEKHQEFAKHFDYNVRTQSWHPDGTDSKKRLYVEWYRCESKENSQ